MSEFLTRDGAVGYLSSKGLPVTKAALEKHAERGTGPRYRIFLGRSVYEPQALDGWVEAQLKAPRRPRARRRAGISETSTPGPTGVLAA